MKINKTFIPLVILLVTFVVTGDANNFVFASPDYDRMNVELSQPSKVIKKHTVQDNENLTVIGKKYNTSVTRIADLNKLVNPNLVIRGQELKVEFLENKSIRVGPAASKSVNFPQGRKVIEHVIYPDKNDLFAPANPVVTYEIVEATLPQPEGSLGQSKTFKSWMSFIKWLKGSDYSKQTKGAGTDRVNPSPTTPYMVSAVSDSDTAFNNYLSVPDNQALFDSHFPDTSSPPPKQA